MEWMGEVFGDDFMVEVGVVGEGGQYSNLV